MTDYELNFSIKVEEMLSKIDEPVFREIVVEVNFNSSLNFQETKLTN